MSLFECDRTGTLFPVTPRIYNGAMAREPTSSNEYRRRANAVGKSLKARSKRGRGPLLKKQKALNDMADNQDWLDGKPKPRAEY